MSRAARVRQRARGHVRARARRADAIWAEGLEARRLLSGSADSAFGEFDRPRIGITPPRPMPASAPALDVQLDAPFELGETFLLHSHASASKTIYLDFNGHNTSGTVWNDQTGGATIVTPAYSFEGDSSFSATELERIQRIWQRVSEDFIPFDVDVTTQDPGIEALRKNGAGDSEWGIRVVIGGDGDWFGEAGGVAQIGSFSWSSDTPCFVFEDMLAGGEEKSVAEAISHEVGHTLGLLHDGRTSPSEEYYHGHGSGATGWAPIMGVGFDRELVQWSRGDYLGASNPQDDLATITASNGFGYRVDDHGDTNGSATPIAVTGPGNVSGEGIIERNTDVDVFALSTSGAQLNLSINPFYLSPNLDILAEIYDSSNSLVVSSNPQHALGAQLAVTLSAGTYFLKISGVGKGSPLAGGYSDYGSLGQYSINSSTAPPVNDNFSARIALNGTGTSTTAASVFGGKETGEPAHAGNAGGRSAWWSWKAPTSGEYAISTAGSNFDTLLAVYTGLKVSNLSLVAANNDETPGSVATSRVRFNAVAGTTYQIAVDGVGGAAGAVSLAVAFATTHTISGKVFQDNNGNGAVDGSEAGIAGVALWLDGDHDGVIDVAEPVTSSNAAGDYVFNDVWYGSYDVRQVALAGYANTTPAPVVATIGGNSDSLFVVDGSWNVVSGTYQITTAGSASVTHLNTRAVSTMSVSGDFELEVDASTPSGQSGTSNDFAVIFGYQDANNYYFFSSNQSNDTLTSGIFRVFEGTSIELADVSQVIVPGVTYDLRVQRTGGQIRVYRNGVVLASATDSTFLNGRVGLGARSNRAVFDNLVVSDPPGTIIINHDFNPDAGGVNHGNFPVVFNGSGGMDGYEISGSLSGLRIVESLPAKSPVTYTIDKSLLGGTVLIINGNGGNDLFECDILAMEGGKVVINGGTGQDELRCDSGGMIIASASTVSSPLSQLVQYAGTEKLGFSGNFGEIVEDLNGVDLDLDFQDCDIRVDQHLKRLALGFGPVRIGSTGSDVVVKCAELVVDGIVEVHGSSALIVDYAGASPRGLWNGAAYTEISGAIADALEDTGFDGLYSTSKGPNGTMTRLGVAEASHALGLSGAQTATWNGETVDATTVLVKYTYAGDADLDGDLDGDDYFWIDTHVALSGSVFGWHVGDFDYDGDIDGDDYFLIDVNFAAAQAHGPI